MYFEVLNELNWTEAIKHPQKADITIRVWDTVKLFLEVISYSRLASQEVIDIRLGNKKLP